MRRRASAGVSAADRRCGRSGCWPLRAGGYRAGGYRAAAIEPAASSRRLSSRRRRAGGWSRGCRAGRRGQAAPSRPNQGRCPPSREIGPRPDRRSRRRATKVAPARRPPDRRAAHARATPDRPLAAPAIEPAAGVGARSGGLRRASRRPAPGRRLTGREPAHIIPGRPGVLASACPCACRRSSIGRAAVL